MNFGGTIKELRGKCRMTQRVLAEQLDVNFTYISKIESGKLEVLPSENLIRSMAKILGVNPDELLDLAGKLDLKRIQRVAMDTPKAGTVLRRIQQKEKITDEQWKRIGEILDEDD